MILVDTSVWIDHLRIGQPFLVRLLEFEGSLVLGHSWVIGELALGNLAQRQEVIGLLNGLPQATVATDDEVMTLVDRHQLYGLGIGYVDAQLLASTQLTVDTALWTGDRRLVAAALRVGCAVEPASGADS